MIDKEKLQEMKDTYLESIKGYLNSTGGIEPHLTLFAEHKEAERNEETAIIHVPIPDKFMKDDQGKERFVEEVIPQMAEKLHEKFVLQAVMWTSEAWVRSLPKGQPEPENYKDLPIEKEIVIVIFETTDEKSMQAYDILRQGKQINEKGELTERVELKFDQNLSGSDYPTGRFTGLLKKFQKVP